MSTVTVVIFLFFAQFPRRLFLTDELCNQATLGRKSFVIVESDNGAKANAILYSLVETAKENRISTYKYFELLLSVIPKHMNDMDLHFIDDLMLWSKRVQRERSSLL